MRLPAPHDASLRQAVALHRKRAEPDKEDLVRRLILSACAPAAVLLIAAPNAVAGGAPNPCTVLQPSKIADAFHRGSAPKSKLTGRHEDGGKFRTCKWGKGKNTLSITTGPSYKIGGFGGGGPGAVSTHPVEGLGAESWYFHNDNPQFEFANVLFMHAPFSGGVDVAGNLPFADVLALARTLYKAE